MYDCLFKDRQTILVQKPLSMYGLQNEVYIRLTMLAYNVNTFSHKIMVENVLELPFRSLSVQVPHLFKFEF